MDTNVVIEREDDHIISENLVRSEGNTIKKAYICHAQVKKIQPNDLLLFYRSQDVQAITALGTVDQIFVGLTDPAIILSHIVKRTVYSLDEIKEIAREPTLVILFHLNFLIDKPVTFEQLKELDIGILRTIISLNQKNYIEIKRIGGIDEHFTFH